MPSMVEEIRDTIGWMAQDLGVTILLVEQDFRLALQSSQVCYVMEKGKIAQTGPSAELLEDSEMQMQLLGVS